mgnify:CR=1 FL=1
MQFSQALLKVTLLSFILYYYIKVYIPSAIEKFFDVSHFKNQCSDNFILYIDLKS